MNQNAHIIVNDWFNESLRVTQDALVAITEPIVNAAQAMTDAIQNGGKILVCGNGGSAADAQHFSGEMLGRFMGERRSLPATTLTSDGSALTAIGNDYEFDQVFARQVSGLGQAGDVLFGITTSGNSGNIAAAINVAHEKNMRCVILNGNDGGKIPALLNKNDIEIRVENACTPHVQEVHGIVIHCICHLIDSQLSNS